MQRPPSMSFLSFGTPISVCSSPRSAIEAWITSCLVFRYVPASGELDLNRRPSLASSSFKHRDAPLVAVTTRPEHHRYLTDMCRLRRTDCEKMDIRSLRGNRRGRSRGTGRSLLRVSCEIESGRDRHRHGRAAAPADLPTRSATVRGNR